MEKIQIIVDHESYAEIPVGVGFSGFSSEQAGSFSFPRRLEDRQVTIYSGCDEKFWGQVSEFPDSVALPLSLQLRCRVWADGLGCAVDKRLTVTVRECPAARKHSKIPTEKQPDDPDEPETEPTPAETEPQDAERQPDEPNDLDAGGDVQEASE